MPLSGLLSVSSGGWPSIFYAFGAVGTIWSLAFIFWVYEDPEVHPRINPDERKYILNALWGAAGVTVSLDMFSEVNVVLIWRLLFFLLTVASDSMEIHHKIFAFLGHFNSAHGSQLRIRNVND